MQHLTHSMDSPRSTPPTARHFTLLGRELLKLSPGSYMLQITCGSAWLSVAGEDIVLHTGDTRLISVDVQAGLICRVGDMPLRIGVILMDLRPTAWRRKPSTGDAVLLGEVRPYRGVGLA